MRRYLSLTTLAFLLGIVGLSLHQRAAAQVATTTTRTATLSSTALADYTKLVKSDAGEAALQNWARTNRVQIVSLKPGTVVFVPDQLPDLQTPQEASVCDHKKCPVASGHVEVKGLNGAFLGWQYLTCTARSCKWVYNPILKRNVRMCGDWVCRNDGGIIH